VPLAKGGLLQGIPELAGTAFMKRWGEQSIAALFAFATSQTPVGRPGSLGAKGYDCASRPLRSSSAGTGLRCRARWTVVTGKILSIRIEESNDPLRLLERLNQPIDQNAVKTTIVPTDAVFVVLEKGVHDRLPAAVPQPGS
jgi:hypothetical protein